ncbi:hypothetical protein PCK1_002446 [Pneumocystis canis]|nr:hypothetical protein PCK1_002446 [Pneumocystis canis]
MTYIIAGRAVKSEYIAIGTILLIFGAIGHSIRRSNQQTILKRKKDPPIHAKSPEEEAFIRFLKYVIIYLFGGITVGPLIILVFFIYIWVNSKEIKKEVKKANNKENKGKNHKNISKGSEIYKTGWLRVAREMPLTLFTTTTSSTTLNRNSMTKSMNYHLNNTTEEGEIEGTIRHRRPMLFFAVLKHGNLFLYDKENRLDVKHVIVLSRYHVSIWPHDAPDGELFIRKNAICLTEQTHLSTVKMNKSDLTINNDINSPFNTSVNNNDILSQQESNTDINQKLNRVASNLSCSSTFSNSNTPDINVENASNISDTNSDNSVSLNSATSPARSNSTSNTIPSNGFSKRRTFFIFNSNPSDQEDWYFSLIRASQSPDKCCERHEDPSISAIPLVFDPKHMSALIQTIHSTDAQLQTRWLNALLGRLFLALYRTRFSEEFIIERIKKKISRIKKPAFLSDIIVKRVDIGDSIPYITNPRLRDLSVDGQLNIDAMITYNGHFRIEIATSATLNLGSRFKSRRVDLVLAMILKKFEGTLALIIKPPPSNRFWFGFYEMPKMDMTFEPIVFSKQITHSMILKIIENKIRETIHNTFVFPYMEDFEFYSTADEIFRGGIWDHSKVHTEEPKKEDKEVEKQENTQENPLETSGKSKTETTDASKTVSEGDSINKPKHSILLTTLRSSGSELKKNSLKRSSSYNTITNNSIISTAENRSQTEIISEDKSSKDLCGKSFVTAAAISAFGKSTALPKTLNKISHSKIFKSEDINKIDLDLDRKNTDTESDSITSTSSLNSLKSSFANKKERLSAAIATMRENTTLFDNKRKSVESNEKSALSLSVSSATNAVRRWGSNYITKKQLQTLTIPESFNCIPSHALTSEFENNKKKQQSDHLDDNPPDYSEISSNSIMYISLQPDESSSALTQNTIHTQSHKHSSSETTPSMIQQPYITNKSSNQSKSLDYDALLSKRGPVPSPPIKKNISKPPALPARPNIFKTQHSELSEKSIFNQTNNGEENIDDQNSIMEDTFMDYLKKAPEHETNIKSETVIESNNVIKSENNTKSQHTTESNDMKDSIKSENTVLSNPISRLQNATESDTIHEQNISFHSKEMFKDDHIYGLNSVNELEYNHKPYIMNFYPELETLNKIDESEIHLSKNKNVEQ